MPAAPHLRGNIPGDAIPDDTPAAAIILAIVAGGTVENRNPYSAIGALAQRLRAAAVSAEGAHTPERLRREQEAVAQEWAASAKKATPWAPLGRCGDGGLMTRGCAHPEDPAAAYFVEVEIPTHERVLPDARDQRQRHRRNRLVLRDALTGERLGSAYVSDLLRQVERETVAQAPDAPKKQPEQTAGPIKSTTQGELFGSVLDSIDYSESYAPAPPSRTTHTTHTTGAQQLALGI